MVPVHVDQRVLGALLSNVHPTRDHEKKQTKQHTSLVNMGSKRNDTAYTGCIRLGRTTDPSSQIESFKTPFDYLEGVCLIGNLAFLKKSAEPPIPFNILEPSAQVELACPYYAEMVRAGKS